MQHIIKRTKLGIILNQSIKELKFESEEMKLNNYFKKVFEQKYELFKQKHKASDSLIKGFIVHQNQFPIGQGDRQQYWRAITTQAKLPGCKPNESIDGQKKIFTIVEGFSKNEDPKRGPNSRNSKSGSKKQTIRKIHKKNNSIPLKDVSPAQKNILKKQK